MNAIEKRGEDAPVQTQPGTLHETASTAAAAQAQAAIQARYQMALHRPRDPDEVRVRLLRECKRPRFAEVARYSKPVGNKPVEGPSIRFAEAALRCLGNCYPEITTTYDDATRRIVRVSVTDLEANLTYAQDVTLDKTVERSNKTGRVVLGERTNTQGKPVYIVQATEDELSVKQASATSKALRQCVLRLLPGDLLDEAMDQVQITRRQEDAQDPDAARKRLIDAFAALGVMPPDLRDYLDHDVATSSPAELAKLRDVYTGIKEGHTTWGEIIAAVRAERGGEEPKGAAALGLKGPAK